MPQVSLEELVLNAIAGNIISFPTDTVPALAVRPDRADRLFDLKKRQLDKPLILMASTATELWHYTNGGPNELALWQKITQTYWPGPLTLVLPASPKVPLVVNPHNPESIGIRVPNHSLAREILAQTGPLATTSANLSGQPALRTIDEINTEFPQVLTLNNLKLEQIGLSSGIPSTVAKWTDRGWAVLRQGAIKLNDAN